MEGWTFEDEAQLASLQERKAQWEVDRRRPLEVLVEGVWWRDMQPHELTNHLIENADKYISALATFVNIKKG
jgi:hypothetical protein